MKRVLFFLLFFTFLPNAHAGPFTDKLAICLVKETNQSDKEMLIQWIFAAMASHPNVSQMSNVSTVKGDQLNQKAASLFTDLLTERCRSETKEALQYESKIALRSSFEVLGKVAMQGIMGHSQVNGYINGLQKYLDVDKLRSVIPEENK